MSLANLLNVPAPNDENAFHEFSFSNQDSHNRIVNAIYGQKGTSLSIYVLDPMPFFDMGVWLRNHQQMHNDMNGVTGIAGNDLSSVDFNDPEQAAYWMQLHWSEHQQNEQLLGL